MMVAELLKFGNIDCPRSQFFLVTVIMVTPKDLKNSMNVKYPSNLYHRLIGARICQDLQYQLLSTKKFAFWLLQTWKRCD